GAIAEALGYYNRGLATAGGLEDVTGQAVSYDRIGSAYMAGQQYAQAQKAFEAALGLKRNTNDYSSLAVTLTNLANVYAATDNLDQAIKMANESLQLMANRNFNNRI